MDDLRTAAAALQYNSRVVRVKRTPQEADADWLRNVWPALREGYSDEEIYSADEIGLFYKLMLDQSFQFEGQQCRDGEFAEDRLTVLVATNMTGTDKRKLLVIGNSENPRSFCNEIIKPVQYEYDHRAWMTAGIFRNFVCRWDAELSRTSSKALLLVDDRSVHRSAPARLRSIRVTYFPDDASSSIRPMRAGLLERLSVNYKRQQILHLAERVEMNRYPCKTTVLRAVRALKSAWENVSPRTVADCFGRVGLTATTGAPVADLHCPTTTGLLDRWAENLLICDSRTLGQYERVDAALATDDRHACAMGCTATTLSRNEEGGDNEVDLNAAFGALDDLKRFFSADGRLSRRSYRHTKRLQTLLESTRY